MTKYSGMTRHLMAGTAAVAMLAGAPAVMTSSAVVAQDYTTGDMTGVVQNEAGTPVSGATVTVMSNRGETRTTVTGANGNFTVPRLPVGSYTVSVSADGYNALDGQSVNVNLGTGAQVTFTMDSMDSSIEELFVVGTATSDWDFNTTTSGISVDVDELFDTTPISRDATSVALLAPGTSRGDTAFGNLASLSGSSVAENVYYVNGLNVTNFRNFLGGSTIPFEFYDQIEVKTGGYPAEFGRSTGGVLNAVTKSGDNEFHFGANIYWQPNFLRSAGHTSRTSGYAEHFESDRHEWNIWASGPIVKDKLFFYALFNPRNTKTTSYGFTSQSVFKDTAPFWAAKFDFIPWDGHHFEATFFNDNRTATSDVRDYVDESGQTTNYSRDVNGREQTARLDVLPVDDISLSGEARQVRFFQGGKNQIFKYTGSFTDWMSISAMYGISQFDQTTQSDGDLCPYVWDTRDTGWGGRTALGCWESSVNEAGDDRREAFRIDADFYFDLAGEHHVRVGVDRENLTADTFVRYSGNIYYRYLNSGAGGSPFSAEEDYLVRVRQYSAGGEFKIVQTAQYIQDSWQVTDDLLLSLGLRNETFDNQNVLGETFIKTKNQLAPRLGFSYDVAGDGSQRLFGSFGRYFLPIAANTNIRLAGAEVFTEGFYVYDYEGPNEGIDPETGAPLGLGEALDFRLISDGDVLDVAELVDKDFDPQYQDEWMLGYERAFDNGWAVGIRGIHRSLKSAIEDVGINHAIAQYAKDNNINIYWEGYSLDPNDYDWILTDPGFTGIIYVLTNPGTDMTVSTHNLGDGSLQEITLSAEDLGYEKARRTYKALEFTFDREWDGKWSMSGSYTLSWTKGNYEGSVKSDIGQDDAGLTQDFDLPSVMEGAYGYLPTDRRHRFKLWGSYQATDQILVGVNTSITSPRKFGCIGNLPVDATIPGAQLNDPTDTYTWNNRYNGDYWFCGGQSTPRGSQNKSDWLYQFDLSVNITPSFAEEIPGDFSIRVDIFNLFNFHGVTDVSEFGEIGQTTARSLAGVQPDNSFYYGAASAYQTPRRVRLGAKYTF